MGSRVEARRVAFSLATSTEVVLLDNIALDPTTKHASEPLQIQIGRRPRAETNTVPQKQQQQQRIKENTDIYDQPDKPVTSNSTVTNDRVWLRVSAVVLYIFTSTARTS